VVLKLVPGNIVVLKLVPGNIVVLKLVPGNIVVLKLVPGNIVVLIMSKHTRSLSTPFRLEVLEGCGDAGVAAEFSPRFLLPA